MKKILYTVLLFSILMSCKSIDEKGDENVVKEDYNTEVAYLLEAKDYRALLLLSNTVLESEPENYNAIYNKAVAMEALNRGEGVTFYVIYINDNPQMPESYKNLWMGLFNYSKSIDIEPIDISDNLFISIDNTADYGEITKFDIYNDKLVFINSNGDLYALDFSSKKSRKINYYKSNDFILIGSYVVYNDSINVLTYDIETSKYTLVTSFESDIINFEKYLKTDQSAVIKVITDNIKNYYHVDFNNNSLKKLPENCMDYSDSLELFVISESDGYKIFDINGITVYSFYTPFYGFAGENGFFTVVNNYLCISYFYSEKIEKIIYIPDKKIIKNVYMIKGNILIDLNSKLILISDSKKITKLDEFDALLNILSDGILYYDEISYKFIDFNNIVKSYSFKINKQNYITSDIKSSLLMTFEKNNIDIYNLYTGNSGGE